MGFDGGGYFLKQGLKNTPHKNVYILNFKTANRELQGMSLGGGIMCLNSETSLRGGPVGYRRRAWEGARGEPAGASLFANPKVLGGIGNP